MPSIGICAEPELPVDVVVVTPDEVERYGDDPYLIIAPALKEGKVVYGT